MKRFSACLLLLLGLLLGVAMPAPAQRAYPRGRGYYGRPAPRRYYRPPVYRLNYAPRYYHAAPYRNYGNRYYYRPRPYYRRPGRTVIIRP
jgi:hypothetical protein